MWVNCLWRLPLHLWLCYKGQFFAHLKTIFERLDFLWSIVTNTFEWLKKITYSLWNTPFRVSCQKYCVWDWHAHLRNPDFKWQTFCLIGKCFFTNFLLKNRLQIQSPPFWLISHHVIMGSFYHKESICVSYNNKIRFCSLWWMPQWLLFTQYSKTAQIFDKTNTKTWRTYITTAEIIHDLFINGDFLHSKWRRCT